MASKPNHSSAALRPHRLTSETAVFFWDIWRFVRFKGSQHMVFPCFTQYIDQCLPQFMTDMLDYASGSKAARMFLALILGAKRGNRPFQNSICSPQTTVTGCVWRVGTSHLDPPQTQVWIMRSFFLRANCAVDTVDRHPTLKISHIVHTWFTQCEDWSRSPVADSNCYRFRPVGVGDGQKSLAEK